MSALREYKYSLYFPLLLFLHFFNPTVISLTSPNLLVADLQLSTFVYTIKNTHHYC